MRTYLTNVTMRDSAVRLAQSTLERARQLGCATGVVDEKTPARAKACWNALNNALNTSSTPVPPYEAGDLDFYTVFDGTKFHLSLSGTWNPGQSQLSATECSSGTITTSPLLLQRQATVSWLDTTKTMQTVSLSDQMGVTPASASLGGPNTRMLLVYASPPPTTDQVLSTSVSDITGKASAINVQVTRKNPGTCLLIPYLRPTTWTTQVVLRYTPAKTLIIDSPITSVS